MLEIMRADLHNMGSHLPSLRIKRGKENIESTVTVGHRSVFDRPAWIREDGVTQDLPVDKRFLLRDRSGPAKRDKQAYQR
jgi:hypothetical protein